MGARLWGWTPFSCSAVAAAVAGAAVLIFAAVVLAMAVIVVVAVDVRIIGKLSSQEGLYRRVGLAADAAIELNARLGQRHLGAAADAAAQEHLHLGVGQKSGQRAVSLAVGVHHLGGHHLPVLDVVELELFRVAEVLENHAVFIGDCNSHRICFLSQNKATFGGDRRPPALLPATGGGCPVAQAVVPAGNEKALAVDQAVSQLVARRFVDLRHGGAGDAHLGGALLLGGVLQIDEADGLVLIQRHHHLAAGVYAVGAKAIVGRLGADAPASRGSRQGSASFLGSFRHMSITIIAGLPGKIKPPGKIKRPPKGVDALERDTGVEPAYAAWEAAILPMN